MADLQKYFESFHAAIRMDYEMSSELRDKRDILTRRISSYLSTQGLPGFEVLLQGSYKMKTGVVPTSGLEYDIDVGLRFKLPAADYSASTVRSWVLAAVDGHTKSVLDKNPCVRVVYADGYHVDLVIYAWWTDTSGSEQFRLAHKTAGWKPADPPALLDFFDKQRGPFALTEDSATKTDQLRRCIRYLRRWNDVAIPRDEKWKPTGLAFLLLTSRLLQPTTFIDGKPDDRKALELIASTASAEAGRIVLKKPAPEYEDVLSRMSEKQMELLKCRFGELKNALVAADCERDPIEACKTLRSVLGSDFPVPDPSETGQRSRAPAIITSSSSA